MDNTAAIHGASATGFKSQLVILFTDLTDSTHLSGAMEAETYAQLLDVVREIFRVAVEARGGSVNQFQGDGLQALFGYPVPQEDDGRRAVDAALEIHAQVDALGERFRAEGARKVSVHSGIHAGLALARPGDGISGKLELFGPAVGIAKHLSDEAEAEELLVSDETLGPALQEFMTTDPRHLALKGRTGPIAVRRIIAPRTPRAGHPPVHGPRGLGHFVGRADEMTRLNLLFAQAMAGQTNRVLLRGSPGLGKTRLAEEFLARAAGSHCQVLRGDCDSGLNVEPLQPFLQMLRKRLGLGPDAGPEQGARALQALLAELSTDAEDLRGGLPPLLHLMSWGASAERPAQVPSEAAVEALQCVLAALARKGPLVLFVDDWQWSDMASRQLAHALCTRSVTLLLIMAARTSAGGELDPDQGDLIELSPFNEAESLAAVRELLPQADPFVTQSIVRQSGGNPLFLEELCHHAALEPDPVQVEPGGPAWLHTLIASRVSQLPPGPRRVIDAAAVIGNVVPARLLQGLTGCDSRHPDVRALATQDLLDPTESDGSLRFKHGITRDVVYAALGLQMRRSAHQTAADLLMAEGNGAAERHCEALAYHCQGAGNASQAARYALMAGDKAMGASSIDRARTQYRAAIAQYDRLEPSGELYKTWMGVVGRLGLAGVFDPSPADLAIFQLAATRARAQHDPLGMTLASYWRAYCHYALGAVRLAQMDVDAALRTAPNAGEPRLSTQIQALHGKVLAAAGCSEQALAILEPAIAAMYANGRPGARTLPALTYSLACHASVLGDLGQLDAACRGFERALAELPHAGHEVEGSVRCLRGNVMLWHRQWDAAAEDALAAQRVAERVGSLYLLAMARALGAWADWKRRGKPQALELLAQANAWLVGRDKRLFQSINLGRLAEGAAARGDWAAARHHAAGALWRRRAHDPLGAPMALRALAHHAAHAGNAPGARRRLDLADRLARARASDHELVAIAQCRAELGL